MTRRCPGSPPRHHFKLPGPNGTPYVTGVCVNCGVTRRHRVSWEAMQPNPWRKHASRKAKS